LNISNTYERFFEDALQMRSDQNIFGHLQQLVVTYQITSFSFINLLDQPLNPSQLLSALHQNVKPVPGNDTPTTFLNPNIFLINAKSILDIIGSEWTPNQWVVIDFTGESSNDLRHLVNVLFAHLQREYNIYTPPCQPSPNMSLIGFDQANLEDLPNISHISAATTQVTKKADKKTRKTKSQIFSFTTIELECISRAAEGMSNMEISQEIGESPALVTKNLASISQKLNAKNRIQAISLAIRRKLI
jgi:DNA-binding CsgD family transcriptional regulator